MPITKTASMKEQPSHTTDDELKFIKNLGCFTGHFRAPELLKNYITACDKRRNWNNMNAKLVKEAAISRYNSIGKMAA